MIDLYNYRATVLRVIDGDTIEILLDYGCRQSGKWKVRLLGINAPEIHAADPATRQTAEHAKVYLQALIEGKEILIHTEKADSWDRLLGQIYFNEMDVNQTMLDLGLAVPYAK